jgi:nucleoid DNA-binding protein
MAMNELVQILMAKTGLSQDKAQEVVDTVVTHLKARLPGPLASHLDGILNGLGAGELEVLEQKAKAMFPGL